MGGYFSGWHGRRSSRPYFDELLRVTIADCKQYPPGLILLPWQGGCVAVRKIIAPAGCIADAPRLQCARCNRACKLVYISGGVACCNLCAGARYRSTCQSDLVRAYITAMKVFRRWKFDIKRPGGKPKWMRWPTFEKREAEVESVAPIIERHDFAPYILTERIKKMRGKRGRPPTHKKSAK